MNIKKFLTLIILLLSASLLLSATEKEVKGNNKISFNFNLASANNTFIDSNFDTATIDNYSFPSYVLTMKKYALSNTQAQKLFLIVGIAGVVIMGTSLFLIAPGAALMAVSVTQYHGPYDFGNYLVNDIGYNLWVAGVGLLTAGLVLFFAVGLPMTIAGFVLYSYYGGKFSMFMDRKDDNSRFGFLVKI